MAFSALFRRLLDPASRDPLPPGVTTDDLDNCIGPLALAEIEELATSPSYGRLRETLEAFFQDERADLALRKAAIGVFEARLRWVSVNSQRAPIHDLDGVARRRLGLANLGASRHWSGALLHLGVRLGGLLAAALARMVARPVWRVRRQSYPIGIPMAVARTYYRPMELALGAIGRLRSDTLLVIDDGTLQWQHDGINLVTIAKMPVPVPAFLAGFLGPAILASARLAAIAFRHRHDPWIRQLCVEAARLLSDSLPLAVMALNVAPRYLIDVEEAPATHILRAMVLGKAGTKVVRWPHSAIDSPGGLCAYLGYDVFLSSGPYQADIYGASWWKGTRRESVGMLRHSQEMTCDEVVREDFRAVIEGHRQKNGKVCGCFLPSWIPSLAFLYDEPTRQAAALLADRPDWMLVIKPKGRKSYLAMVELCKTEALWPKAMEDEGRVVLIDYPADGVETCSTGWLMQMMDIGIGVGSVQYEAVVHGKPVFGYYPWPGSSPLQQKMVECGLLHQDKATFAVAVRGWLDASSDIPFDWFRDRLDPWADDRSMQRAVDLLVSENGLRAESFTPDRGVS